MFNDDRRMSESLDRYLTTEPDWRWGYDNDDEVEYPEDEPDEYQDWQRELDERI